MIGAMKGMRLSGLSRQLSTIIQDLRLNEISVAGLYRSMLVYVVVLCKKHLQIYLMLALLIVFENRSIYTQCSCARRHLWGVHIRRFQGGHFAGFYTNFHLLVTSFSHY